MKTWTRTAMLGAGTALMAGFVVGVPSAYAAPPAGTVTPYHVPDCSGNEGDLGQRRTIYATTVAHTDERAASPVKFKVPSHMLVHVYYPDGKRRWWVISYSTRWTKHCGWMWHSRIRWNESS